MVSRKGELLTPRLMITSGMWIDLPQSDAWVLGRSSRARGHVDVDLAEHDSIHGVSRWHARIQREGSKFVIEDLGSTNFTTVNGYRLAAHQRYPLVDGDRIGLGSLRLTIFLAAKRN